MKKILSLLIVCVLIGCSFYSNKIEERMLIDQLTNKGTLDVPILYLEGEPFSGMSYDIHTNGDLSFEGKFIDSKLNGLRKRWYKNGVLNSEGRFSNGKRDGIHNYYYNNGQLESEENYSNGKRNGSQKYWDENGQLKIELNFINGIPSNN